jgi:hypothetical protein
MGPPLCPGNSIRRAKSAIVPGATTSRRT